jgi:hypothetical protein
MSQIFRSVQIRNDRLSSSSDERNGNLYVSGKILSGPTTVNGSIKTYSNVSANMALTASDIISYQVVKINGSGQITVSFPTATLLLSALPYNTVEGDSFDIIVISTMTGQTPTFTIAAGTGGSIVGTAAAALATDNTYRIKVMITGDLTSPAYELYLVD